MWSGEEGVGRLCNIEKQWRHGGVENKIILFLKETLFPLVYLVVSKNDLWYWLINVVISEKCKRKFILCFVSAREKSKILTRAFLSSFFLVSPEISLAFGIRNISWGGVQGCNSLVTTGFWSSRLWLYYFSLW